MVEISKNKWISRGIFERVSNKVLNIKELPIGMWRETFKEKVLCVLEKE
jgi:hypothetical protein